MRASHILIEWKGFWPPERRRHTRTQEEAYRIAVDLRRRLLDRESFANLAAVHSDCPSGEDGGDLGYFLPGDMAPAFEVAVQALEVGGLSHVIRTEHGWHVILKTG